VDAAKRETSNLVPLDRACEFKKIMCREKSPAGELGIMQWRQKVDAIQYHFDPTEVNMKSQLKRIICVVTMATLAIGGVAMVPNAFAQDASAATDAKAAHKADRKLAHDVRRALEQASLDVDDVRILVKAGGVSLDGTVPDADQLSKVPVVAAKVPGVMSVANNLTLREEGR
jgi:hyperosmotically inducible periplasmic protein